MQNYLLRCLPFARPETLVEWLRWSVHRLKLRHLAKGVAGPRHEPRQHALTDIYTNVEPYLLHFSDTAPRADHFDSVSHTFHEALGQSEELACHDILSLRF